MNDQVNEYLDSLSESGVRKVAFNAVERLVDIEEVRFFPEEGDSPAILYWVSTGEDLRGDLR